MAVFGVHVFRRRGPFVFDAWPRLARVENCPPRRNAPVEALGVLLGRLPPWPNHGVTQSVQIALLLSSGKKNLLSTYSKILFRFNFLRLP